MVMTTTCRYCRKSEALDAPAAGYIYEDHEWLVAHAPPDAGHAGTLVVSSRRHFLDMTEMTDDEVLSFAALSDVWCLSDQEVEETTRNLRKSIAP